MTEHALQRYDLPEPGVDRRELIKAVYARGATDEMFALYLEVCKALRFDPRARQAYLVTRANTRTGQPESAIQIGVDGYRLLATRSGRYAGTDLPLYCGPDGQWVEAWASDKPPTACKVAVWSTSSPRPTWAVALYREFQQNTPIWGKMPAHMLAIAAERHALRRAFQHDISAALEPVQTALGVTLEDGDGDDGGAEVPALRPPAAPAEDPPAEAAPGPESSVQSCRSCGAPILWGLANGKPHPFDWDSERHTQGASHFASCPDAKQWRRPKVAVPPFAGATEVERWAHLLERAEAELDLHDADLTAMCHGLDPLAYLAAKRLGGAKYPLEQFYADLRGAREREGRLEPPDAPQQRIAF